MKKSLRIKKNEEIEKIIKQRNTVGDKYFVIYQSNSELTHFRVGLSVSKKFGNAVQRNLVKNRIRNVLMEFKFVNKDIFIVIKPTVNTLTFEEIRKDVIKLLHRANLIIGEQDDKIRQS